MSLLAALLSPALGSEKAHASTLLHLLALAVGVIVLDMGAQMTQVANQTRIFGLVPSARSRLNTVYMTVYFTGAAAGSALATIAWVHWGWNGVCLLALGLIALGRDRACNRSSRRRRPLQGHGRRRLYGSLNKSGALGRVVSEAGLEPATVSLEG